MTLAERIRWRREQLGLTQEDIARHFGITRNAVQQWEAGKTAPRGGRLRGLAGVLQRSVQWLVTGEGEGDLSVTIVDRLTAVVKTLPERDQLTVLDLAESLAKRHAGPTSPLDDGPAADMADAPARHRQGGR